MKIVQYNLTTTTKEGGVETFVWELSRHLARRGHSVTIVGGAGQISRTVPGVRVLRFPFVDRMAWRAMRPLRRHIELTKLLERVSLMPAAVPNLLALRPDIVHLHKPYDFLVGPLLHAVGARVIYHGHGEDFYPLDRPLSRTADAMLSCSGYNATTVAAHYGTQPEVVFNGFDGELFVPQPADPELRTQLLAPDERAIVQIGRLQPWKGMQYAIEALRLLVPRIKARLLIGGAGTYRPALERLVAELGLTDHVTFLGNVPHQDVPQLYALADVVLGTSFASETFGMALCEALACERPVIASDWAGYREVVIDRQTGLIVPAQDPPALAAAIERLLCDRAEARRLAANGRQHVHAAFTWEAVTDRVEAVYQRLVSRA
ncbi:MAG TPA: glycosyltransferase family 4 protein [Herpetosiphonaceae bacterium]